jgi:ribonuclease E
MANKMLIDASHPEETRVVVLRGNRVEEFDFESASKRQLRGNIYLAKVTRVEPSLQAAFIEYGGNRHGFLAFSEIHPDYYQIPVADRQALLEEEARAHAQEEDEERATSSNGDRGNGNGGGGGQQRRGRRRRPDRFQRRRRPDESVSGAAPTAEGGVAPSENGLSNDSEGAYSHGDALSPETGLHSDDHVSEAHDALAAHEGDHHADHATEAHGADHSHETTEVSHDHQAEMAHEPATPVETPHEAPVPSAAFEAVEATVAHELAPHTDAGHENGNAHEAEASGHDAPEAHHAESETAEAPASEHAEQPIEARQPSEADEDDDDDEEVEEEVVEQIGGDAMEEMPHRAPRGRKQYKIQEVIKRRQVLLVQVVKEERGSKGAALTTYLSLAGRYSVLMPNTARGGGISRKITDASDRKRLKEIAGELEVPEGMGVILRTAGASRTPGEVRRDFEYLLRMWESVRELTLKSTAPNLVYEEGSLIKRSIRDLYSKEIDEVTVAGDTGYREARDYMRMLMPSHEKNVKPWSDPQALFAKSGVEAQLDQMFSNVVTLRSGGYLVINQAEALVAIDVNSGRSTREHNIEDTALRTNLEAADEVARQLRLRDLAGLIVVDFIDMEEHRNNRAVERRIKDALKNDRARIQVGRISHFGLLEMSRQRMRTGVLEGSTVVCPHCAGAGHMRSTASLALHVLRAIEDALARSATHNIMVRARSEVALYVLNHKRANLRDIEQRFSVQIIVAADDTLTGTTYHAIERGELASPPPVIARSESVRIDSVPPSPEYDEPVDEEGAEDDEAEGSDDNGVEGSEGGDAARDSEQSRRRRRRRRRGRGDREGGFQPSNAPQPPDAGLEYMAQIGGDLPASFADTTMTDGEVDETEAEAFDPGASDQPGEESPRTPRPRRGGARRRRGGGDRGESRSWEGRSETPASQDEFGSATTSDEQAPAHADAGEAHVEASDAHVEAPAPAIHVEAPALIAAAPEPEPEAAPQTPRAPEPPPAHVAPLPEAPVDPSRPKRSGWWQRAKQSLGGG